MVSGNYKIAQLVCNGILYTTHLNRRNGSAGIHLNTYERFQREKGKKRKGRRYETEEPSVTIGTFKKRKT